MHPIALAELQAVLQPVQPSAGGAGSSEAANAAQIRIAAGRAGVALWRNNSGAMTDERTGRLVRFGLGNESKSINDKWKSSDLIGITPVTHAGRMFGVFTAIETKQSGWHLTQGDKRGQAQSAFNRSVQAFGGFAGFATGADDLHHITNPRRAVPGNERGE